MSRCFPFPPPGYEKKTRPDDDANFLIKEKDKEKNHKKDKRDKEKKEKREKKDKERSSEKNREKKDQKRKHKDKKNKNKGKAEKFSEEKKVIGSSGHRNGEKLGPIGIPVDQTQQSRLLLELEKEVGNENEARETRSVDKSGVTDLSAKSSGKELDSSLCFVVEGNQKFKDKREEIRMPNGQSLKVSAKHLENGFHGYIPAKEQRIFEGAVCHEEKVSEKRKQQKDKNKHKTTDGSGDRHNERDRESKSKSKDKKKQKEQMKEEVKEVSTSVQSKLTENGNNAVDTQYDRGSNLYKGSNAKNGNLGKRKESEMNGFMHGNGTPINKLPRPLSSSKGNQNGSRNDASDPGIRFALGKEVAVIKHKLDAKASCSSSVPENGTKLESRQTANNYAPERQETINSHHHQAGDSLSSSQPAVGIRRKLEPCQTAITFPRQTAKNCAPERQEAINGPHHKASDSLSSSQPSVGIGRKLEPCQTAMNLASKEQGMVTNHKLGKKVLSSQLIVENGRKLESSRPSNISSAERGGLVSKPKLDDQESRINGLVGLKKPDASSMRPSPVSDQLKETFETYMKPPHPDAKYLSRILSLPKVEWSDIDDQAWLFAREDHGGKKPKIDSTALEESKQVWAEALQLEYVDVNALPYVIPY